MTGRDQSVSQMSGVQGWLGIPADCAASEREVAHDPERPYRAEATLVSLSPSCQAA